ncbi:RNA polymerase sigma factor SigJ [Lentzea sp. NBRC 102530]|uniref:RNA polymerase sigma factor SigJ n=1 Tax=Lentzea sp. NBRC 102530 TaxID=3032201 RepID=UPI0024A2516D|nr:RNA polymerase sigma factor SigJ [Lentzea sp. NBRC 102530]GLY48963.1 RNA polymerase sigma24 factor [Lentzea sp. NBRC 102530]
MELDELFGERRRLMSLAFRMTGTLADAEDVVQETYLRWYRLEEVEREAIANPVGWLTRVASRVALDLLGSARRRRERYIGQWLPEPVNAELFMHTAPHRGDQVRGAADLVDPLDRVTLDDAVGSALLVVLEAMTPAERVAFVMHDVFGISFNEIAEVVGRSPAAVRQLATAGRRHVRESRVAGVSRAEHDRAVRAFLAASRTGDVQTLMRTLAPDVQLRVDGGGHVNAAANVVEGPDRVARFLLGSQAKLPMLTLEEQRLGDGLGVRMQNGHVLTGVVSFGAHEGLITQVLIMINPEKLTSWIRIPGDSGRGEGDV